MASNGYIRSCCNKCLFYVNGSYGFPSECILYTESDEADKLQHITAVECEYSVEMKNKYYEKCEHFANKKEIRNEIRTKFGIDKIK